MTVIRTVRFIVLAFFFLAYPYLVYHWLDIGRGAIAPAMLMVIFAYQATTARRNARVRLSLISLMLAVGLAINPTVTAKLTPAMIHLSLGLLFGKTLIHSPSLVERLVRMEYPEFPPGVSRYCRHVTIAWTVLFVFNLLVCLILALSKHNGLWAIYNGAIVFLLMGGLALGEYRVRCRRFPMMAMPAPLHTMIRMVKNSRQVLRDVCPSLHGGG